MTKTVKKRLQAVVALLVTLMIMVGIMPYQPFNMTVYAANTTNLNDDIEADDYYWVFFDTQGISSLDQSHGSTNYHADWSSYTIQISTDGGLNYTDMGYVNPFINNGSNWGRKVWCIGFGSQPTGNVRFRCKNNTDNKYRSIQVAYARNALYRMANEYDTTSHGWRVDNKDTYKYKNTSSQQGSQQETITQGEIKDSTFFGANLFDYYYDDQTNSNSSSKGDLKGPFQAFNEAISGSSYGRNVAYPMYLGQFWRNGDTGYDDTNALNMRAGNTGDDNYTGSVLSNFKWRANLALRNADLDPDTVRKGSSVYYSTVSGLVDGIGKSSDNNNVYVPKSGNYYVPYFDAKWLTDHRVGNAYSSNMTFYKRKGDGVSLTSDTNTSTQDYYVFDSSKDVYFYDVSTQQTTEVKDASYGFYDSKNARGFFPFNLLSNNTDAGGSGLLESINYGFGLRLDISFQLTSDGTFDGNGGDPMLFRFKGDDDVWVFIDDTLVLDMGGAHKLAEGEINFKDGKVAVEYSATVAGPNGTGNEVQYNSNDNSTAMTQLGVVKYDKNNDNTPQTMKNFLNSLKDGKPHKMTMFYMERGMSESNLYVQFNMVQSNDTYTLVEETDFGDVNYGLLAATEQAAEYDVFNYAIQNTSNGSVAVADATEGVNYPTKGSYTRTSSDIPTPVTTTLVSGASDGTTPQLFKPTNSDYLVKNTSYWWTDAKASLTGGSTGVDTTKSSAITDSTGHLRLMYGTADDVSKAQFEKQFAKGTKLLVNQETNLWTTTGGTNGTLASVSSNPRTTTKYYTTVTSAYDADDNAVTITPDNGLDTFSYGSADDSIVKITQYYVNTVNTGSITIQKQLSKTDSVNANPEFEFTITFSNIFGRSGNNISAADYENIITSEGNLGSGGTFTLQDGGSITISGIPIGTTYTISETNKPNDYEDEYFQINGTGNSAKSISATELTVSSVTYVCTNTPPDPEEDKIDIGIIKRWYPLNSSTTLPTEIKFLLQKKSSSGDWEDVTTVGANGVVTLTNANSKKYNAQGQEVTEPGAAYEYMEWKLAARITVPKENGVQYRILEYSEGDKALILLNEGLYATDCKAYYKDGNNDTNVKALLAATYANNTELIAALHEYNSNITASSADADIETAITDNKTALDAAHISTNKVVDLAVKNEYIPMGTAMPKTGARGVYAIVTFGAFAITIAGVALLIYRKKLQTVNIYAVKGSEKKKE